MEGRRVTGQLDPWADAGKELDKGELYLERTEKLLFRRLWEYIISEDWESEGKVITALLRLGLV